MEFSELDINVKKKQGNLGVARAIYEYSKLGYTVLLPFSDSDKYDLVVDDGQKLLKVQVKTSRYSVRHPSTFQVNLATKGGNAKTNTIRARENGDYDLLFVSTSDGRCWSIPESAIDTKHQICVGPLTKCAQYELVGGG